MPWKIFTENGRHCVYKVDEDDKPMGKSLGCHDSEKEAQAQMAALYASEESKSAILNGEQGEQLEVDRAVLENNLGEEGELQQDLPPVSKSMSLTGHIEMVQRAYYEMREYGDYIAEVYDDYIVVERGKTCYRVPYTVSGEKVEFAPMNEWDEVKLQREWVAKGHYVKELGEDRLGFYGHLWGNAEQTDLHGEFFTKNTEGITELFDQLGFVPLTYQHFADPVLKASVLGRVDTMQDDEIGKWMEAQITNHNLYRRFVQPLVREQKLYPSSETTLLMKNVTPEGEITRWVDTFVTLTPTPAEFRMLDVPVSEIKSVYKSVGGESLTDEQLDNLFGNGEETAEATGVEETRKRLLIRQRQLELESEY